MEKDHRDHAFRCAPDPAEQHRDQHDKNDEREDAVDRFTAALYAQPMISVVSQSAQIKPLIT